MQRLKDCWGILVLVSCWSLDGQGDGMHLDTMSPSALCSVKEMYPTLLQTITDTKNIRGLTCLGERLLLTKLQMLRACRPNAG